MTHSDHSSSFRAHTGIRPEQVEIGDIKLREVDERDEASIRSIPPRRGSPLSRELLLEIIRGEYRYAMAGLILGLATVIGGVILGLAGVTGTASWTAKVLGFESQLFDAAPGVVLFLIGLFAVFFTRPKIKIGDIDG